MKSIKPGRGPSAMGGFAAVIASIFGVFWTIGAASIGAPPFFLLFGALFILMGIVNAVYSFKNAAGKHRYSEYDIVDDSEEPDPLNQYFGSADEISYNEPAGDAFRFCPYCGAKLGADFTFCGKCGRKLPENE